MTLQKKLIEFTETLTIYSKETFTANIQCWITFRLRRFNLCCNKGGKELF